MIDFPASPTVGQTFTAAGVTWTWDGTKWLPGGLSSTVVGGINDNRIINGDFRIDQRNGGASGTAINVYTVDRWFFGGSVAAKGTWRQNLNATTGPAGFPYYLGFQSSSAYTPLTADAFSFYQTFEGDAVSDFAWGTASAQPVTLSFWARSSLTGTFGGAIQSYTLARSYPFNFSIPAANTWTRIVVTIPGDTTGAWVMSGNAASMLVIFDLGTGATYRGSANAWASSYYNGVTSAVNVVATNAATFYVTGVKLEVGSVATPFNRQSLAKSMADCQRYYSTKSGLSLLLSVGSASQLFGCPVALPITMRANPTIAFVSPTYSNASGITAGNISPDNVFVYATATGSGGAQWSAGTLTASAEF